MHIRVCFAVTIEKDESVIWMVSSGSDPIVPLCTWSGPLGRWLSEPLKLVMLTIVETPEQGEALIQIALFSSEPPQTKEFPTTLSSEVFRSGILTAWQNI